MTKTISREDCIAWLEGGLPEYPMGGYDENHKRAILSYLRPAPAGDGVIGKLERAANGSFLDFHRWSNEIGAPSDLRGLIALARQAGATGEHPVSVVAPCAEVGALVQWAQGLARWIEVSPQEYLTSIGYVGCEQAEADARKLRALVALATAPTVADWPEGWKLVPREPDRAMWANMGNAAFDTRDEFHDKVSEAVWTAGYDAAPPPPARADSSGAQASVSASYGQIADVVQPLAGEGSALAPAHPSDAVAELVEHLRQDEAVFRDYAAQHMAKAPPDTIKAERNLFHAERLAAAVAKLERPTDD